MSLRRTLLLFSPALISDVAGLLVLSISIRVSNVISTMEIRLHSVPLLWFCIVFYLTILSKHSLALSYCKKAGHKLTSMASSSGALLEEFLAHDSADFHNIREPAAIRAALLDWYDNHRRMLPWRGDPPPWIGSTASKIENRKIHLSHDQQNPNQAYPLTAYGVWVSEIMCQQTRVEAVIPYWLKWMKAFPTVHDLAAATDDQVNQHWAGLGFYRRARLLHNAAKHVVNELEGELPRTVDGLQQLSGVGRYTACAIASIAFNVTVPVVDGNVCRVLSRLSLIANHIKAPELKDKWAWQLAEQIVQTGDGTRAGCVNSALMELGATYCSPSGTGIDDGDPLRDYYLSNTLGDELLTVWRDSRLSGHLERAENVVTQSQRCPVCVHTGISDVLVNFAELCEEANAPAIVRGHAVFPLPPPKQHKREEVFAVLVLSCRGVNGERRWLLVRRPKSGLLANQWEFPAAMLWNSDDERAKSKKRQDMTNQIPDFAQPIRRKATSALLLTLESDGEVEQLSRLKQSSVGDAPIEHVFSHVRHTMWLEYAHCDVKPESLEWINAAGKQVRWMAESDMNQVGVTSGVKKILTAVGKHMESVTSGPPTAAPKRKRIRT